MSKRPIVTLLTDFGTRDGYVAAMKGVMLSAAPEAEIVDAAHEIPPQDIRAGAWVLGQYASLYPAGTIHVAVVDPGVGTSRRALCARIDDRLYLAPDNGLLWWVLQRSAVLDVGALRSHVHRPGEASATFHGRDVFAYAAGLLASGASRAELTEPFTPQAVPAWGAPVMDEGRLRGEVIHVDRFGNLVTNIPGTALPAFGATDVQISLMAVRIRGVSKTYQDVPPGQPVAYVGSDGFLELGVNMGSAALLLAGQPGQPVIISVST